MNPSDTLINELTQLEKDYSRARRNQGVIYSAERMQELLELRIADYKKAISILVAHKL